MPLYEYECNACSKVFEVTQKFSDAPLTSCEACQGPLKKLISRTSFQLKGAGWYATDYKKPSTAPSTSSTGNSSSSSSTSDTSTPATPAKKPD